jgi:simple sugar transport system ATP-binding protein
MTVVLRLDGITKRFGRLVANDDVTLDLHQGELLALLGENGAGKTTLMNILFGHVVPDTGRVVAFGEALPPGKPRAAIAAGIGMVHQHFVLAANLTVLENIIAGTQRLTSWRADSASARRKLMELAQRFGLIVALDARVGDLSVGERQRVEILKALYRDARILILDEPTAVLTYQESQQFFATLRSMATKGLSLIFISHRLHEVMEASDRVVVLRGGRVVAERRPAETSRDELAELMVGRRVARPRRESQPAGAILLEAEAIAAAPQRHRTLTAASFHVRAGEILGIVGVSGNGQTALAQLLSGQCAPLAGRLTLFGAHCPRLWPRACVAAGIGRVPEDRNNGGAIGDMALWENAVLERVRERRFSVAGWVRKRAGHAFAADIIARFDVRGGTPNSEIRLLSGGNMQKFIVGRSLANAPRLLIAAQPTRGLDEGAVAAIQEHLLAARRAGVGILLISEDLDDILQLADRVQAIVAGRLSPAIPVAAADPRRLGLMMAGVWDGA